MAINKISTSFINGIGTWTPVKKALQKINELIDTVNGITDGEGTETFENIEVTDTATIATITGENATFSAEVETNSLTAVDFIVSGNFGTSKTAVTQLTSITTTVVANTASGVITTVASTLAADAAATFTVTNDNVTATSVISLTASTQGTGTPVATINSRGSGTFNIKLYNVGSAALNNTVTIDFIVVT